jgi:hypothetical protein
MQVTRTITLACFASVTLAVVSAAAAPQDAKTSRPPVSQPTDTDTRRVSNQAFLNWHGRSRVGTAGARKSVQPKR